MRPNDRKYTKSHEWVKLAGEDVVVGITDFAVQELCSGNEGDLVSPMSWKTESSNFRSLIGQRAILSRKIS